MPQFTPRRSRLRPLLIVLAITTLALLVHQFWRLYGRSTPNIAFRRAKNEVGSIVTEHYDMDPLSEEGSDRLAVQFDEDGEIDLATMQRMLDILYKKPRDPEGYESLETSNKNEYRFRKDPSVKE
ncbi:hypothetical protein MBRA1_001525 [Malassezia brasiliensis]|uniref:Uncharacterized protein n=1 Tax=Malassezia brasiliensis TaxID=1821822 RepID=A0AAF0DT16_9BASI|nr:hypothetical protein MBRA1_001525 [Malassezia brasiliensis]